MVSIPVPQLRQWRIPRLLTAARGLVTWAAAGVTLFICYLHVAGSAPVTSDGASNALQAWDMLHGNLLLHGWQLSDVSFYPTELAQYMLVEHLIGLRPQVVHVASAMTYTVLVLLAAQLAKGRATGREALTRCLLAAGIMLAPQAGNGVYVLMGSPDHAGSAVPVLVTFLILDRTRRRWYTPAAAGALLCLALIADSIVLYIAVLPVVAVSALRIYQARFRLGQRWREVRFELALGCSALGATWVAAAAVRAIRSEGGFAVWPVPSALASPADLPRYLVTAARGLLLLFGANFFDHHAGFVASLAAAHLIGLGLAAWATCTAIRGFQAADLTVQLLACGTLVVLAAYVLGTRAGSLLATRDITAVLPFGAALAGRLLASRLTRANLLPALGVVLAGYLFSLGRVVTLPAAPPAGAALASWLSAHRLSYGLAGYWNANVITLDTGGRIALRSVLTHGSQITGDYWEVRSDWYAPRIYDANFIVLVPSPPGFRRYPTVGSVRATFGQPLRIYYAGSYTIMVYDKNLLATLGNGAPLPPRKPPAGPPAMPLPGPG